MDLDRVLALQGLDSIAFDDGLASGSGGSNVCSVQSSGQGNSSCSIACGDLDEVDW